MGKYQYLRCVISESKSITQEYCYANIAISIEYNESSVIYIEAVLNVLGSGLLRKSNQIIKYRTIFNKEFLV